MLTALSSDLALLTFSSLLADIQRPNLKSAHGPRGGDIQLFNPFPLYSLTLMNKPVYIHKKYTPLPPLPILYILGEGGGCLLFTQPPKQYHVHASEQEMISNDQRHCRSQLYNFHSFSTFIYYL